MRWPAGIRSAGVAAGIKSDGATDVGLLVAGEKCSWAGAFTQNAAAAAPVLWSRDRLGTNVRALVVTSGNANACTGADGERAVEREAAAVGDRLGCDPGEVLVAATGPIGVPLPVDKIVTAVPAALEALEDDAGTFASAILTTDTRTKVAHASAGASSVVGVAKGAAMVAPNMATMLAFIATDATIDATTLQKIVDIAVDRSFNRITIDGCESTNDSVFMFATGAAGEADLDALLNATTEVCISLAHDIVSDAEGGSRVVRIRVEGAASENVACDLARAAASSALWRAAVHGRDPNWGRIASALGSVDRSLSLDDLSIAIGDASVYSAGEPGRDLTAARAAMDADEIPVTCVVGGGPGSAEFLTSDLSPEYVALNAEGTT